MAKFEQPKMEQPKINKEKVETDVLQPRFLEREEFSKRFSPDMKYQDISEKDIQDFRDHILGGIEENKKAFIEHMSKAGTPEGKMNGNIWNVLIGQKQRAFAHKVFARAEGKYLPIEQMGRFDVRYFLKKGCNYMAGDKDWDKYFNDGEMPKEFKAELEKLKAGSPKKASLESGAKKEKLSHEIELEQRPEPQEGEAHPDWLKRIGGPNAEIVEDLEKYLFPKEKAKIPLIINKEANFILNDKNLGTYFDKEKIDAEIENKNPNVRFNKAKDHYQLKKELFKRPELYFHVIGEELKNKRKIVADKNFGASLKKWLKEAEKPEEEKLEEKEEKAKEKPKKEKTKKKEKPEPEKEKKPLTLDEQIAQKQKELEEVEMKHNIYYSPVVQDLLGLYYDKRLNDLRKEMKELGKEKKKEKKTTVATGSGGGIITGEPEGLPEEVIEPSYEEQFEAIQGRLKELPIEIRKSSVLGRSKLEKEQKRLEKKLKKSKKK